MIGKRERKDISNSLSGNEKIALMLVLLLSFSLRFYPAFTNEFPKGSDSFFHMRIASEIKENGNLFLYDPLTNSVNPYPPVFHVLLAASFFLADAFTAARFVGPVLSFLSVAMFFVFVRFIAGKRVAIASTFVYGIATEIINKSVFASPENLGFLLIFTSLYATGRWLENEDKKYGALSVLSASLLALTHPLSFIMLVAFLFTFFSHLRKMLHVTALPIVIAMAWFLFVKYIGASTSLILNYAGVDYFLLGFSPALLALAVVGISRAAKIRLVVPAYMILVFWVLFLPFYPERVLTFSIVPGALMAGLGINELLLRKNKLKFIVLSLVVIIALAHAVEINNPFGYAKTELTEEDYETLLWARDNLPENAVIAGTWQVSGAWINSIAERRTILGAFQESVEDYKERRADLQTMFTSSERAEIKNIAAKYDAEYIFANSYEEKALYTGVAARFRSMFPVVKGDGYAYVFKIE